MKPTEKNPLEKWRGVFFLAGLALVLWMVTAIMQWDIPIAQERNDDNKSGVVDIENNVPITVRKIDKPEKKTQPEPEKRDPDKIKIVDNKTTLDLGDLNIDDTEEPVEEIGLEDETKEAEPISLWDATKVAVPYACADLQKREEQVKCLNRWISRYIRDNMEYPEMAREMRMEERIFIQFVVDTDGGIKNVEIARGENHYLREEALRVINSLPEFRPAGQNGMKVPMRMNATVNFKLQ